MTLSLYKHLCFLAERNPNSPALLSCTKEGNAEKTYTFGDLKQTAERLSVWFGETLGLRAGDSIALALPNSGEFLLLSWSAWMNGITTVPLDMRRDIFEQYTAKIRRTRAKVLISEHAAFSEEEKNALRSLVRAIEKDEVPFDSGAGAAPEQARYGAGAVPLEEPEMSRTALILFTSGTTADPKGVELTLGNLFVNAQGVKKWFEISEADRFLVLLPLSHINSTTFCLASLLGGAGIAVVPGYSNSRFWKQLADTQSTFTSIVPTICYDQLSRREEFESLKGKLKVNRIQIGSAPVVPADVKMFIGQFRIQLYQGYGQTETALRVTGVPLDTSSCLYERLVAENSIGKPMDWADVQVFDNTGRMLGEGEEGEICVKGAAVMTRYLNDPNASSAAFYGGYFRTGDLGCWRVLEGARYFFLKGRIKEIIIKGGVNISPVAVEQKLRDIHPDVQELFVVGVPDRRYGEEIAALVCWKKSDKPISQLQAELAYLLSGSVPGLTAFEAPHYLVSVEENQISRTPTGKVQRTFLKQTAKQENLKEIRLVGENREYRFLRLGREDKQHAERAFEIFQRCWQPLLTPQEEFLEDMEKGVVIAATDRENQVRGLVTIFLTGLGEEEFVGMTYHSLKAYLLSENRKGKARAMCVSICVGTYEPPQIPQNLSSPLPSLQEMETYLISGNDVVFNFHRKPKAGMAGAELVALLPNSRPEDRMALGYNMLLKYPSLPSAPSIQPDPEASLAVQLMEAAMTFCQELGVSEVYAFSRPAGALPYFQEKSRGRIRTTEKSF